MKIEAATFRQTLGQYPTGVCIITSAAEGDGPTGFVVGSFTSVSLDPPIVGFFPAKGSTSWPRIERTGKFCVNVLSEDQQWLCQRFASKRDNKFEDVHHRLTNSGLPILNDIVAWIDCTLHAVHEAGDHFIVLGAVQALGIEKTGRPLIFCQGQYGQFAAQ